jgi:hypothetical protein
MYYFGWNDWGGILTWLISAIDQSLYGGRERESQRRKKEMGRKHTAGCRRKQLLLLLRSTQHYLPAGGECIDIITGIDRWYKIAFIPCHQNNPSNGFVLWQTPNPGTILCKGKSWQSRPSWAFVRPDINGSQDDAIPSEISCPDCTMTSLLFLAQKSQQGWCVVGLRLLYRVLLLWRSTTIDWTFESISPIKTYHDCM